MSPLSPMSPPPVVAYLGLGANLGERAAALTEALARLESEAGIRVLARSPVYETEAVTPDAQPPYLNAAARIETTLPARALLAWCLEVEAALGRRRPAGRLHAPREIDIDLLLYGEAIIAEEATLIVPHPRLLERAFVRIPLADVALPGLVHPLTGEPLDRAAFDRSVVRLPDDPSSSTAA